MLCYEVIEQDMSELTFLTPAGAGNAPLPIPVALPISARELRQDLPQRRSVRLPGYDYSQAGWYFVTIMAREGRHLFGSVTPEAQVQYTQLGAVACQCWLDMAARYPLIHADAWVVMPNHAHLLVGLLPATHQVPARTIGQLVAAFKATTTRLARPLRASTDSLWQRGFHEHVIRNASELEAYRSYIQHNPRRWLEKKTALPDI